MHDRAEPYIIPESEFIHDHNRKPESGRGDEYDDVVGCEAAAGKGGGTEGGIRRAFDDGLQLLWSVVDDLNVLLAYASPAQHDIDQIEINASPCLPQMRSSDTDAGSSSSRQQSVVRESRGVEGRAENSEMEKVKVDMDVDGLQMDGKGEGQGEVPLEHLFDINAYESDLFTPSLGFNIPIPAPISALVPPPIIEHLGTEDPVAGASPLPSPPSIHDQGTPGSIPFPSPINDPKALQSLVLCSVGPTKPSKPTELGLPSPDLGAQPGSSTAVQVQVEVAVTDLANFGRASPLTIPPPRKPMTESRTLRTRLVRPDYVHHPMDSEKKRNPLCPTPCKRLKKDKKDMITGKSVDDEMPVDKAEQGARDLERWITGAL